MTRVHLYLLWLKVQVGFSRRGNEGTVQYRSDTRTHADIQDATSVARRGMKKPEEMLNSLDTVKTL